MHNSIYQPFIYSLIHLIIRSAMHSYPSSKRDSHPRWRHCSPCRTWTPVGEFSRLSIGMKQTELNAMVNLINISFTSTKIYRHKEGKRVQGIVVYVQLWCDIYIYIQPTGGIVRSLLGTRQRKQTRMCHDVLERKKCKRRWICKCVFFCEILANVSRMVIKLITSNNFLIVLIIVG